MKKSIALLLVLLMAAAAFAGCAVEKPAVQEPAPAPEAPKPAEPEPPKTTTLTVVTSYGGDDGNRQNFEASVSEYETLTGNKVQDGSATSNEQWKAKVMTDFETGTEPDVLFYFLGNDANPFIEANKVVSLDEIRAAYPDYAGNMKESMLVPSPADNKIYAVPSTGFWESMFVNTKVLADAGVAVPGAGYTWDQFLSDCEKIKAKGLTPVAVSLQEVPHYWFEFAVFNNGNSANHLDVPAAATDATGQKWVKGFEDLKQLYDLSYLPKNTLTATDAETVQLMLDNEAAFLIDGSWKVGFFVENAADHLGDFKLAYVPGKGERKATDIIGGISMGYYITRKAWDDPDKREAAVKFVQHLTSDEVISRFVTTEVTALKNGAKPAGLNEIQQSAADMCGGVTTVVFPVQDLISSEAKADLFGNVKNIVTGGKTAAEAVDAGIALNK